MKLRCRHCKKTKTAPKVKSHPANEHWEADPYCSRKCLEAHEGVAVRVVSAGRLAEPEPPKTDRLIMHGTETGYKNGCHCESCRHAARVGRRERRQRKAVA